MQGWQKRGEDWWFCDMTATPDRAHTDKRAYPRKWQTSPYETKAFSGVMLFANPAAAAPAIRVPLPPAPGGAAKRWAVHVGLAVNYCDRINLKLERDACYDNLCHTPAPPTNQSLEEVWWRDIDALSRDVLIIKQDEAMGRRCGVGFVRLTPAPPATKGEVPIYTTADGMAGNNGPVSLDQMMGEELNFDGTHVTDILHGTDVCGSAQYMSTLPGHRYTWNECAKQVHPDNEYYPWTIAQMQKFEREGRCPLRDSIKAAHSIGRKLYAYHRMAIVRIFAPYSSLFYCTLYDEHPEWRCVDFDGTQVSRMSYAFPEVRRFIVDHLRETVEFGADGVCLVFNRGWPLALWEEPVRKMYREETGKPGDAAALDDPVVRSILTRIVTGFMREVRAAVNEAGKGRDVGVIALTLATPEVNARFGMDCAAWVREGLVDSLVPYPYGEVAKPALIDVDAWLKIVRGSKTKLCPIANRMSYEPAGIWETPKALLDRAEQWLAAGVDGLSYWDLDSAKMMPTMRALAYHVGSREGRRRIRAMVERGPVYHELLSVDGLRLDRYHPGWNV